MRENETDLNLERLTLKTTTQQLIEDEEGYRLWRKTTERKYLPVERSALLLCDVWDDHWSKGARERLEKMVGRMNEVVQAARRKGLIIIHAPSETTGYYEETAARRRAKETRPVELPQPIEHVDPPLPVDASDEGSDTGQRQPRQVWTRQHPAIEIDQERDYVSDEGEEIFSILNSEGVNNLFLMGVHANMCILNRSFGIKKMVSWGVRPILIKDLTDAMYNPERPPYVSHEEGTRLVVEYIEKFWCPTVESEGLIA